MRFFLRSVLVLVFISLGTSSLWGAVKKTKKKNAIEMDFDELLIRGKYHFSDESVLTVEDEKILNGLLEIRKDYKDRVQKTATWY